MGLGTVDKLYYLILLLGILSFGSTQITLVKDFVDGSSGGSPSQMISAGDTLYFTSKSTGTNYQAWYSDGTESGTDVIINDVASTSNKYAHIKFPDHLLIVINSELYIVDNEDPYTSQYVSDSFVKDGSQETLVGAQTLKQGIFCGVGANREFYAFFDVGGVLSVWRYDYQWDRTIQLVDDEFYPTPRQHMVGCLDDEWVVYVVITEDEESNNAEVVNLRSYSIYDEDVTTHAIIEGETLVSITTRCEFSQVIMVGYMFSGGDSSDIFHILHRDGIVTTINKPCGNDNTDPCFQGKDRDLCHIYPVDVTQYATTTNYIYFALTTYHQDSKHVFMLDNSSEGEWEHVDLTPSESTVSGDFYSESEIYDPEKHIFYCSLDTGLWIYISVNNYGHIVTGSSGLDPCFVGIVDNTQYGTLPMFVPVTGDEDEEGLWTVVFNDDGDNIDEVTQLITFETRDFPLITFEYGDSELLFIYTGIDWYKTHGTSVTTLIMADGFGDGFVSEVQLQDNVFFSSEYDRDHGRELYVYKNFEEQEVNEVLEAAGITVGIDPNTDESSSDSTTSSSEQSTETSGDMDFDDDGEEESDEDSLESNTNQLNLFKIGLDRSMGFPLVFLIVGFLLLVF